MIFDWNDSLNFCTELKEKYIKEEYDKLEAVSRTIINRAYYSAFNKLSKHLKDSNIYQYNKHNPTKSSHKDIIEKLEDVIDINSPSNKDYISNKDSRKRYNKIIRLLKSLKENRKLADYDDTCLESPIKIVNDCINNAKQVFTFIDAIEKNLPYDYKNES